MRIRTRGDLSQTEPTSDQCNERFVGKLENGLAYMACWYPQMGGYSGRCWVVPGCWSSDGDPPGFDAYVWHDGEFPFGGDSGTAVVLHHCASNQFMEFGRVVNLFLVANPGDGDGRA